MAKSKVEKPSSQLSSLPGETWEDIFREEDGVRASDFGPKDADGVWRPHRMTGSDWDAILGRTRSTETKGETEQ